MKSATFLRPLREMKIRERKERESQSDVELKSRKLTMKTTSEHATDSEEWAGRELTILELNRRKVETNERSRRDQHWKIYLTDSELDLHKTKAGIYSIYHLARIESFSEIRPASHLCWSALPLHPLTTHCRWEWHHNLAIRFLDWPVLYSMELNFLHWVPDRPWTRLWDCQTVDYHFHLHFPLQKE